MTLAAQFGTKSHVSAGTQSALLTAVSCNYGNNQEGDVDSTAYPRYVQVSALIIAQQVQLKFQATGE